LAEPGSNADFILSNGSSSVIGISTENNKILLELDQPVYDPTAGISYAGHAGDAGGWILNSDGFGMFSFYNLPVESHTLLPNFDIPGIMSGPGNCIQLDGQNDCIFLGPVLSSSYTKEAWVQWLGGGIGNNILSGASGTAFWAPNYGVGNQLSAGHNNGWSQVVDPTPLKPYEWMHVAVSYDASTAQLKLYKNGYLVAESQGIPPHSDPNLYIGAFSGAYTFHGKIDEVRVWDYARSLEEIRNHMCKKLKGNEVGLSAYFRLDQQDGLTTLSATGNNSGQVLGAPTNFWKRSPVPLGTHSTFTYEDKNRLSLAFDTGDSLVWEVPSVPTFAHVYLTNEIPNVLEPADGHVLVDNSRYFGVYFPKNEIDSFHLTYHYKGNSFTLVDEPRLSLLQRKDNAQPFWLAVDPVQFDFTQNTAVYAGKQPQEMILAIAENTVGIQPLQEKKDLLYPNPTRDWLFVRIPDIVRFRLLDNHGQTCIDQKGPVWVVNLQELPAGIYHAEAELQGGGIYRQKIMVE
jgi:hypothetical protein